MRIVTPTIATVNQAGPGTKLPPAMPSTGSATAAARTTIVTQFSQA